MSCAQRGQGFAVQKIALYRGLIGVRIGQRRLDQVGTEVGAQGGAGAQAIEQFAKLVLGDVIGKIGGTGSLQQAGAQPLRRLACTQATPARLIRRMRLRGCSRSAASSRRAASGVLPVLLQKLAR